MRYELMYYELKQKKFNSKKTLDEFLKKLTPRQQLRVIRREKGIWYMLIHTHEGWVE